MFAFLQLYWLRTFVDPIGQAVVDHPDDAVRSQSSDDDAAVSGYLTVVEVIFDLVNQRVANRRPERQKYVLAISDFLRRAIRQLKINKNIKTSPSSTDQVILNLL